MTIARALISATIDEDAWLTSTVTVRITTRADARDLPALGSDLVAAIGASLPSARFDARHVARGLLGVELGLVDPANQDARIDALAGLEAAALGVGGDADVWPITDWILTPARDAITVKSSDWLGARDVRDQQIAWSTRYAKVSDLRAPILAILLATPKRHAISAPAELAAVHGGLPPAEAWLLRAVIRNTPKTRPGAYWIRDRFALYKSAELAATIDRLEADDWIVPNRSFGAGVYNISRGPRARRLSSEDLLVD